MLTEEVFYSQNYKTLMPNFDYTQLIAIAIIFVFFIKEIFMYLRLKEENKNKEPENLLRDIAEIKLNVSNHLTEVQSELKGIEKNMSCMYTDIAIIKNDIRDILIKINKNV